MSNQRVIKRNGQEVVCFGPWHEDSKAVVVGDFCDGSEMKEVWAEGATNWTEAVETITAWAKRNGHQVVEMSSC